MCFEILKTDNLHVAGVRFWEQRGFESADSNEITRHINFYSYYTKIKCTGSNILARSRLPVSDEHSADTCFTHLLWFTCGNA
jgi:hypothetical protein